MKEIFTEIYRKHKWHSTETVSGPGSTVSATKFLRSELEKILKIYNITSILDIPCGDFNWMRLLERHGIRYLGMDIVDEIIVVNRHKYSSMDTSFQVGNITSMKLPPNDLIIVRDCLPHFSLNKISYALNNIFRSGCKYLLTTTFTTTRINIDIETGGWRPINLQRYPFLLKPICKIREMSCKNHKDKSLILVKL